MLRGVADDWFWALSRVQDASRFHLRRLSTKLSQWLTYLTPLNRASVNRAHMCLKSRKGLGQDVSIPRLQAIHVDAEAAGKAGRPIAPLRRQRRPPRHRREQILQFGL